MCVYTSIAPPSFISHIRDCCFKKFKQYVQRVLNRCCGCDLEDRKLGFFVNSGHIYPHISTRTFCESFISLTMSSPCLFVSVLQSLPFRCLSGVCCFALTGSTANLHVKEKYRHVITRPCLHARTQTWTLITASISLVFTCRLLAVNK